MSLQVPKFGNPPLPWNRLPWRLKFLRASAVILFIGGLSCITTLFVLQFKVFSSPRIPIGIYTHPVSFKGDTFYLSDPFFRVWTTLSVTYPPLWLATFSLILAGNNFEYRIKRRLWDAELGRLVERTSGPTERLD